jgi:hypothetical protein
MIILYQMNKILDLQNYNIFHPFSGMKTFHVNFISHSSHIVKAPKYLLHNINFENVEPAILDKSIWKDNPWVQTHNSVYLIGHANVILATLDVNEMSDFPVYLIELKGAKGPIPISKILKNCVPEGQTTYQLEHGEELFIGLNWNDYFLQQNPIPSVTGKKSQEAVWYSGRAPKLMQFYQDNYRRQTVSWIGKKMEKIFKGISYSTLIRFVTNIVDDLSLKNK